ncbi:MAG: pucA [Verrucomicrobia bacterium]|nr:pucA [Verrucomicrobiota bacterium]
MKELLELAAARGCRPNEKVAVATVLRVDGSSYRRTGARMLVNADGRFAGSVSGGCLEQSVIVEAQAALHDGRARLLAFDTSNPNDLVFGTGLGCQGKIWIGIEVLPARQPWLLADLAARVRYTRQPAVWVTHLVEDDDGIRFLSGESESRREAMRVEDVVLSEAIVPPVALLVFGGGPDVNPLVELGAQLGHEVTVIDRRPDVAQPANFPAAHRVIAARPPLIRPLIPADDRTVAVLMNHHYETDRDVLATLLPMGLPYIAMLGPQRRTARILAELRDSGLDLTAESLDALHGPAGLDIGADDPAQIALSILAEIQATLSGRQGGKLKFRDAPIHADIPDCLFTASGE